MSCSHRGIPFLLEDTLTFIRETYREVTYLQARFTLILAEEYGNRKVNAVMIMEIVSSF